MRTMDAVRRSGVIGPERTIRDAAGAMEQAGVGALAVIDGDRLVGIVTDRDLVRRALARGLPPDARVDAAMTAPVAVVRHDQFVGMITTDDLLIDLAADPADLARPVTAEVLFAHRDSPVPATA